MALRSSARKCCFVRDNIYWPYQNLNVRTCRTPFKCSFYRATPGTCGNTSKANAVSKCYRGFNGSPQGTFCSSQACGTDVGMQRFAGRTKVNRSVVRYSRRWGRRWGRVDELADENFIVYTWQNATTSESTTSITQPGKVTRHTRGR